MTALLSKRYFENSDSSVLVINKYNKNPTDKYPTFSICFKGTEFPFRHDLKIFNEMGLNATQYQLMLRGEQAMRYKINYTSGIYKKIPVLLDDVSNVDFKHFILRISDFLLDLNYQAANSPASSNIPKKFQRILQLQTKNFQIQMIFHIQRFHRIDQYREMK